MNKKMQEFGKTLLLPISIMSFMAIFMGLSSALRNETIIEMFPFLGQETVNNFLLYVNKLTGIAFAFLPLLFAMAIPLGMVKKDKEIAVYSSVIGYIAMLLSMQYLLSFMGITPDTTSVEALMATGLTETEAAMEKATYTTFLGLFVYNMNVIGGMIAGLTTVFVHNKFRQTDLPAFLAFYSGKRFVPIMNVFVLAIIGAALVFVWPYFDAIIIAVGGVIASLGDVGAFIYGFVEKAINPTGLHHILNEAFRFTALGGTAEVNGETYVGALNIYFAQLNAGAPISPEATQYLAGGKILNMVFGLPAAVAAMVSVALPHKRKKVLQFFIPALAACILTGITEPIEFTFIFISPVLYLFNCFMAGMSFFIAALFDVAIGNIQGGIIDWIVFGVLQGMETKWYIYLVAGPAFAAFYFFVFRALILKLNVPTLGRLEEHFEDDEEEAVGGVNLENNDLEMAKLIVKGLGGRDNIVEVDNCISRLRVEVKDSNLVDQTLLKKSKPSGIIQPGKTSVHIVYGGKVVKMRNIVDDYLE